MAIGELLGALADDFGHVPVGGARAVVDLALVGLERLDLRLDRIGDVDPDVGVVRPADVGLADLVRLEPFGQQLREDVRVARRGVDRVEGGVAGRAVVRVIDVALGRLAGRWVLADDDVRLEAPDLADDVLPKLERVLEDAVLVAEEDDLADAEASGGRLLHLAAGLGQRGRADRRV